jgi:two-component system, sensor histidine kinase and response regulator
MPIEKQTILVVDDAPANLKLLSQVLGPEYRLLCATRGQKGLDIAAAQQPDIILLDIVLPDMDGFETCARLKADAGTRDIPVLFISALDNTADKVHAFAVGGVDYVTKPIEPAEVRARVETHLRLRQLQRQLQAEVAERGRLIADLDAYAATVAHDLKSPVSLVLGYAEYLLESAPDLPADAVRAGLQAILNGGRKTASIVDSLLLLASTRRKQVESEPLNMKLIVDEAVRRLAVETAERRAEIVQPETWPAALGYAPWVEEVWANYLSNALKYGGRPDADPPAPPRIELGADDDCAPFVRFWVRDNGVGIPAEQHGRLFAPFCRVTTSRESGHGLGLSIVQRIVERLGGEVGVVSAAGKGSTFSFTLRQVS